MSDHYNYLQGRRFAVECLSNIRGSTPAMVLGILKTLEVNAGQKPPSEARGIMDIVTMVRIFGVMG